MNPEVIKAAKGLIKKHEGLREKMYLDATGHYTIGFGHNLQFMPISDAASNIILDDDLEWFTQNIPKHIPWFGELNEARQAVLLDCSFNLGIVGLLRFRKMLNALAEQNWELAADEMLNSLWARQVGQRAIDNAKVILTGVI